MTRTYVSRWPDDAPCSCRLNNRTVRTVFFHLFIETGSASPILWIVSELETTVGGDGECKELHQLACGVGKNEYCTVQ